MTPIRLILMLSLIWSAAALAAPREYRIDPVHSRVLFSVEHLGLARALGTFSAPRGWLRFDPADWASARGEIEIDLATLDFGDADWNRRMARRDGFDSVAHPVARWTVQRVEPTGERSFNAHGLLLLRGAEYPLVLAVQFNGAKRHPLTLRRVAGFSARASLSRAALGFDKWKSMVGDTVELQVEVEAQRDRRAEDRPIEDGRGEDAPVRHDGNEEDDDGTAQQP